MAWIKMRASLFTHPKTLAIAEMIGSSRTIGQKLSTGFNGSLTELVTRDVVRDVTVASLMRVWCAANEHTNDGTWHHAGPDTIDQIAGLPGFGEAMVAVGWLTHDATRHELSMPNFSRFNVPERSRGAERQRRYRERLAGARGAKNVTSRERNALRPREEKRRVYKKPPIVPLAGDVYAQEFAQEIRPHYPRRSGDQRWTDALSGYRKAREAGVSAADLRASVTRYMLWCVAEGKIGTGLVLQAGTFFGRNECWRNDWAVASAAPSPHARLRELSACPRCPRPVITHPDGRVEHDCENPS